MPTTSTSAPLSSKARKKLRPIRPNPLMPTLMVTGFSSDRAVLGLALQAARCSAGLLPRSSDRAHADNAYILVREVTAM